MENQEQRKNVMFAYKGFDLWSFAITTVYSVVKLKPGFKNSADRAVIQTPSS